MERGERIMLKNYLEMIQKFGEQNAAGILLLEVGIRLYPILSAEGFGLHTPIAVIVEDEDMIEWIVGVWAGFAEPQIVSLSEKKRDFQKKINRAEYELVAALCTSTDNRNRENVSYLSDVMISRCADNRIFHKLAVVFFVGGIPADLSDLFAGKIIFEKKRFRGEVKCEPEYVRHLLNLFESHWQSILEKINDILNKEYRENIFLTACEEIALVLLNADANADEEKHVIRMFEVYVNTIKNAWIIKEDYSEWIERLRDQILEEGKKFVASADRIKAFTEHHGSLSNVLFFDDKYYYITEKLFSFACRELSLYIGMNEMKNALVEADILIGEGKNRKYFSVKLPISTPEGVRIIGRRMRIVREWIDRPGGLTWHEQIEMQERRGEDCD